MFLAWTDITGDYYLGFCFEMGFGNKKLLIFLQVFCKTGLWHLQKIFGSSHVLCIGEPTTSRALALFFITVTKSPVWLGDTLGLWCSHCWYAQALLMSMERFLTFSFPWSWGRGKGSHSSNWANRNLQQNECYPPNAVPAQVLNHSVFCTRRKF